MRVADGLREPDVLATLSGASFGKQYATAVDFVVEVMSEDARDRDEATKQPLASAGGCVHPAGSCPVAHPQMNGVQTIARIRVLPPRGSRDFARCHITRF